MRVMTWNVRSLKDSRDDVVEVIRAARPDVLCLQESPRLLSTWRVSRLANDCGLAVASSGPPVGALSILTAPHLRVVASLREPLPWTPGLHRRGLLRAIVEVDGRRLQVGSIHLGLKLEERQRHATLVMSKLRGTSLPAIVAGDINETDTFPAWLTLTSALQDAWLTAGEGDWRTFSTQSPRRRIDGVFVDRRLTVTSCEVIATDAVARASDHRPLIADVGWRTVAD